MEDQQSSFEINGRTIAQGGAATALVIVIIGAIFCAGLVVGAAIF